MSFFPTFAMVRAGLCLGTVSQTNTYPTFDAIGNGSSTGFADQTFVIPKTGVYLIQVEIGMFSGSATDTVVALLINLDGSSIVNSYSQHESASGAGVSIQKAYLGQLAAGSHTFNLLWSKISGGNPTVTGSFSSIGWTLLLTDNNPS